MIGNIELIKIVKGILGFGKKSFISYYLVEIKGEKNKKKSVRVLLVVRCKWKI